MLQINKTVRPSQQTMAVANLGKVPTVVVLGASQVLRHWTRETLRSIKTDERLD